MNILEHKKIWSSETETIGSGYVGPVAYPCSATRASSAWESTFLSLNFISEDNCENKWNNGCGQHFFLYWGAVGIINKSMPLEYSMFVKSVPFQGSSETSCSSSTHTATYATIILLNYTRCAYGKPHMAAILKPPRCPILIGSQWNAMLWSVTCPLANPEAKLYPYFPPKSTFDKFASPAYKLIVIQYCKITVSGVCWSSHSSWKKGMSVDTFSSLPLTLAFTGCWVYQGFNHSDVLKAILSFLTMQRLKKASGEGFHFQTTQSVPCHPLHPSKHPTSPFRPMPSHIALFFLAK